MSSPILVKTSADPYGLEENISHFLQRSILTAKDRKMCILVGREELTLGMGLENVAIG